VYRNENNTTETKKEEKGGKNKFLILALISRADTMCGGGDCIRGYVESLVYKYQRTHPCLYLLFVHAFLISSSRGHIVLDGSFLFWLMLRIS
jgi:hypothetical protein